MATTSRKTKGLESSLKSLSLSPPTKAKATRTPIADSWEETASPSSEDDDTSSPSTSSRPSTPLASKETPGPPPPTPSSPTHFRKQHTEWGSFPAAYDYSPNGPAISSPPRSNTDKRPEKSSAAAGRMIAGALGVKAPKKTEEGRAYEKAVREKERRRREREREDQGKVEREREEAKRAVWDG